MGYRVEHTNLFSYYFPKITGNVRMLLVHLIISFMGIMDQEFKSWFIFPVKLMMVKFTHSSLNMGYFRSPTYDVSAILTSIQSLVISFITNHVRLK